MSDSEDETLNGFIVPSRKRKRENTEEEPHETESEVSAEEIPEDDNAITELLKEEASKIVKDLSTTVVNGRTLRDRTKITAPKDDYWERFGKKNLQKLAVSEHKREMLDDLKAWKKEFSATKPEFVWTSFAMKDSVESIEAFHAKVISTFELELADDDDLSSESEDEEKEAEEDDDEISDSDEDESSETEDDSSEEDSSDDETEESTEE